jgi:Reverse transcriptase (RNA-dependent DNA polymerase)
MKKGYIRPSKSPYAAPFFFIKKKDGKLRPVQDYRRVNQWTIRNRYPLPLISQLINKVRSRTLFTKFDIRWGYNNVRIKQGDEWKAAFIMNQGLFEPTVMFFGLTNSPATFQMMMDAIFAEEMREGWLVIYMDDMLIATDDDPRFHELCVHRVLTKLAEHDLYLKPEKCVFEQRRVDFLGVVLQHGTIHMDPTKTQGVSDWPRPTNVTEVRAFLGFTGFY